MSGEKLLELALRYGEKNFDFDSLFLKGTPFGSKRKNEPKDFSNEKLEETLRHKLHPKQLIFCNAEMLLFCEVEYSYITNRNNERVGKKLFVFNNSDPSDIDLQGKALKDWSVDFNKKNPHRQIADVKLISCRYFNDIDEFLGLNLNPKQIIFCSWSLNLNFSKVAFKYTTPNNNKKESSKILVYVGSLNPQRDLKPELINWVEKSNKENPKKSLLNVKFLKSENLGYIKL